MYYETMLEKLVKAQPDYQGSPYQRMNEVREQILGKYNENQSSEAETTNVNFTINGKKVK